MSTILLRLDAPLQSWGVHSRFGRRDTGTEPSKSGIVGLLAAALGLARDADISELAALTMAVRCDREGQVERDYHTAGDVPQVNGGRRTIVSERHYLADACFLVAMEGKPETVLKAAAGLTSPVFPLFLGRKAFAAPPDLLIGVTEASALEAVRTHSWLEQRAEAVRQARQEAENDMPRMLRVVHDDQPGPDTHLRYDHPLSFARDNRQFAPRHVRTDFIPLTGELLKTSSQE